MKTPGSSPPETSGAARATRNKPIRLFAGVVLTIAAGVDLWQVEQMPQTFYFHITLEPHHRHSGARTGRKISFLGEVPVATAKKTAKSPDDEQSVYEEAERLAANLTSMAMTGRKLQPGEDEMRVSFHAVPAITKEMMNRRPDAEKEGVRLWLLGADVE